MLRTLLLTSCLVALFANLATAGEWSARKVHEITGFNIPECVVVDAAGKTAYVSNVAAARDGEGYDRFWQHDGVGFISRLKLPSAVDVLKWQESDADFRFSGLKGMCLHDGWLWVTDIDRVVRFSLDGKRKPEVVEVPGAKALNDMASDGKFAYVTDSGTGKCYRLHPGKAHDSIPAPEGINGITFADGKMYAASWGMKEIYELDPAGKKEPRAFGLTAHFTTPDGIEVLADGTFLVSDSEGNQIVTISADGKTVKKIIDTAAPADIGLDRERGLLYVPLFFESRVEVYQLEQK